MGQRAGVAGVALLTAIVARGSIGAASLLAIALCLPLAQAGCARREARGVPSSAPAAAVGPAFSAVSGPGAAGAASPAGAAPEVASTPPPSSEKSPTPEAATPASPPPEEVPNPFTTPRKEFLAARERAREAACRSNLKQIDLALMMYCADYDECFPRAANWCDGLSVYMKNDAIFQCPSLAGERCAYAYNQALGSRPSGLRGRVRAPQTLVTVFEAKGGWNRSGGPELVVPRHADGPGVAYADGHVKSMGQSNPASWRWQPGG